MVEIKVSKLVEMSAIGTATAEELIGTQGCATCVGLIVRYMDRIKICAHFSCQSKDDKHIMKETRRILIENFTDDNIDEVFLFSTAKGGTTEVIKSQIVYYFEKFSPGFAEVDGAYSKNNGDILPINFSQVLVSDNKIENQLANIG